MPNGYGRFGFKGKPRYAHRAAFEMFRCEIPEGMHVCHTCDVRECVNPDHLFLGTHADNMRDAWGKGRLPVPTPPKVQAKRRKLNAAVRAEILASKEKGIALAKRFKVTPSVISMIRSGKRAAA